MYNIPDVQQYQAPPPAVDPRLAPQLPVTYRTGLGGMGDRLGAGIQNFNGKLFASADPNADPAYLKQQQNNALLMLGLGMLSGNSRGQSFGTAALGALSNAQNDFQGAMQNAYRNRLTTNEDKRRTEQDQQQQDNWKWSKEHGLQRETVADRRQVHQDQMAQQEADRQAAATSAQIKASGASVAAQGANTALDQYKLEQAKKDAARRDELLAIPNRTPAQEQELNMLAGGTPQGMLGAQYRDPLYGVGQGGASGVIPGGNPLLQDPELGVQPPPQRTGASGSW
jgi:hypothetical protein